MAKLKVHNHTRPQVHNTQQTVLQKQCV